MLEDEFAARVPSAVLTAVAAVEAGGHAPVALHTEPTFTSWTAETTPATPLREPTLSRWGVRSRKQSAASVDWEAGRDQRADRALEHAESGLHEVLFSGGEGVEPVPLGGAWRSLSDVVLQSDSQ